MSYAKEAYMARYGDEGDAPDPYEGDGPDEPTAGASPAQSWAERYLYRRFAYDLTPEPQSIPTP